MQKLIQTNSQQDILELLDRFPVPVINQDTTPPSFHFKMPDWTQGGNWREHGYKAISGDNDWEVILNYLNRHSGVKNSYMAYCAAIEKFILFLLKEKKVMPSALKREDFDEFFSFLAHPEPDSYWVGDRHRKFDLKTSDKDVKFINPDWRPFVGQYNMSLTEYKKQLTEASAGNVLLNRKLIDWGMSDKSIVDVSVKVATMFRDLFEAGYLKTIPIIPKKVKASVSKTKFNLIEHFLEKKLIMGVIDKINNQIDVLKEHDPYRVRDIFTLVRDRFIIKLFFTTGLRIHELSELKIRSVTDINNRWVMNILGKGDKPRQINLHKDTIDAINEFRSELGATSPLLLKSKSSVYYSGAIRASDELDWPMVPQRDLVSHICVRRIDQIIKPHFQNLADEYKMRAEMIQDDDFSKNKLISDASRLEHASAHWLRHSHGTYFALECNRDMKAIMERLGHSKSDTTMVYLHVVDKWFDGDRQVDYSVSY